MTSSRRVSKERTRARLIQGTLKVLYREGSAALTTGRIAESAGVAQPTFYVHFSGIDEALQHAAELVSDRWIEGVRAAKKGQLNDGGHDSVRSVMERYIAVVVAEPKLAELYLRHRRDASLVLGRAFRRLTDRARQEMCSDLAVVFHVSPEDVLPIADLALSAALGVVECVLDRRSDLPTAVESASHMVEALVVARLGMAQAAE